MSRLLCTCIQPHRPERQTILDAARAYALRVMQRLDMRCPGAAFTLGYAMTARKDRKRAGDG